MKPAADCQVYIDGTRAPDTGVDYAAGVGTILADLSVKWGRDGGLDQPGPATCGLRLVDLAATSDFLDRIHVGSQVTVYASGVIPGGMAGATVDDGTMNSWRTGDAIANRYALGVDCSVTVLDSYTAHKRMTQPYQPDPAQDFSVILGPRQFATASDLPTVWDGIPQTSRADSPWSVTVEVRVRAGSGFQVAAYGFTTTNGDGSDIGTPVARVGTGDWQAVTALTIPGSLAVDDFRWVGVRVSGTDMQPARWSEQIGTWSAQTAIWADAGLMWLDNYAVTPPAGAVLRRRVAVFDGAVTDLTVSPMAGDAAIAAEIIAVDLGGTLANRIIGDIPWSAEPVGVRAERIIDLAGLSAAGLRISPDSSATVVSYRDVDAQSAVGLLQDLAQSIGDTLWVATNANIGPFIWFEDPDDRAAVRQLVMDNGVIIIVEGGGATSSTMSACDILQEPVKWSQTSGDVVTVVAVQWLEQTLNDEGIPAPTERQLVVNDTAAQATYGTIRYSVSTELTGVVDAGALAGNILARSRYTGWKVDGLTMDTATLPATVASVDDRTRASAFFNLLDGTARMGASVTITDMPDYAPRGAVNSVFVEGGSYSFDGLDWRLEMTVTPSAGQGHSAEWGDFPPDWQWMEFFSGIHWVDLYGAAVTT
jgi:hypothetical protein